MIKKLNQRVTGKQFKGETWDQFLNHILDFFIPTFNKPILLVPQTINLFDIGIIRFGENNLNELCDTFENNKLKYKVYIFTTNRGRTYKTEIPKILIPEMIKRIKSI